MKSNSLYYELFSKPLSFSPIQESISVDVLVVGGGISGLSTAYNLAKSGVKVALVESGEIGYKTSGRSAGMITRDVEADLNDVDQPFAQAITSISRQGIDGLLEVIETEDLDCQLEKNLKSLYVVPTRTQQRYLGEELEVRKQFGIDDQLLIGEHSLQAYFHNEKFRAAIWDPKVHSVNPLSLTQELAKAVCKHGGSVFPNTRLVYFDAKQKVAMTSCERRINFDSIVLSHGLGAKNFKLVQTLRRNIVPVASHILVTRPLSEEELHKIFPTGEKFQLWDSKVFYNYARVTPDNRILFGGAERTLTRHAALTRKIATDGDLKHLQDEFKVFFPQLSEVEADYFWGGVIPAPIDGLPFLGEVEENVHLASFAPCLSFGWAIGELTSSVLTSKAYDKDIYNSLNWQRAIHLKDALTVQLAKAPMTNRLVNKAVNLLDRVAVG